MRATYEEINGNHGYKMKNFIVFNVPHEGIPYNLFDEIGDYLDEGGKIPNFDENRNILDNIYSDYILVEYTEKNIRDKDIENNKSINIINPIKSEAIDSNKQLAENVGNFEYNNKYYLVLNPYNAFTEETNSEKGLFRGVIIDSNKYFEVNNQVKDTNSQVKNILDK